MKVSDRRKFEKANFDEFESALNNKNDLVHCPSITLFESIPTEVRSFYEDEPDFQGGPIPSKYLIPKKINLMVYTLFQVHTLKFNRKDYDTLSLFYLNRGYYNELSLRVLERCHEIASARPNDSSTMLAELNIELDNLCECSSPGRVGGVCSVEGSEIIGRDYKVNRVAHPTITLCGGKGR
ncbi:AKH_1a_G0038550.mRNA.1.CDS.1 [Saccharomyces cerevisiae]|nr:AKH_1a_G0038550.mRNA.1.CDS.1 [Saccharomyces cerevisiae]CAI6820575.1 AKH_1a_G0038550.mRNA.1.CDS.1 [Saccharomyces cerevisiae]